MPKIGRPTIAPELKRKDYKLHLTPAEIAELQATAKAKGLCPREYLWQAHKDTSARARTVEQMIADGLEQSGLNPDIAAKLANALTGH